MTTTGVAIVGYGYWGANLARNARAASTLRLVGIVDADEGQRAAAASANPGCAIWSNLDEALADPAVEAVIVAAPAAQHAVLTRDVLSSGRHAMVEKPLAMTTADAQDLVDMAERAGLTLMVGHTFLYSAPVLRLAELIASGDLGTVQYVYSQRLSLGRIRRDCNALWNFAPHDLAILMFLLGESPAEVSATSMAMIDPSIADVFFVSLKFPSGVGAHVHVSWIDPRKSRLMTFVGDQKMAVYDDVSVDQKLALVDAGVARDQTLGEYQSLGDFQWRTRAGDILIPRIDLREPLLVELEAFGDACASGQPARSDGRSGVEVVRVLEAADESARRRGAPVELTREF